MSTIKKIESRSKSSFRYASSADFVLGDNVDPDFFGKEWRRYPYCIDCATKSYLSVYVPCRSIRRKGSFEYAFLRQEAQFVQFENLQDAQRVQLPASPITLIFSPGRAGSTLLASGLAAAGANVIAEPDTPTSLGFNVAQSVCFPNSPGPNLSKYLVKIGLETWLRDVTISYGEEAVIKLRGICSYLGKELANIEKIRIIFIDRDIISWAKSNLKLFNVDASYLLKLYDAYEEAKYSFIESGGDYDIVSYEELVQEPLRTINRLRPHSMLTEHTWPEGFGADAHALTGLSRDSRSKDVIYEKYTSNMIEFVKKMKFQDKT